VRRLLAALIAAGACSHAASGPAEALSQFGSALEQGDLDRAYALMSESYRKRVSLAEFKKHMKISPEEARADGRVVRENAGRWGARVEVVVGGDERLTLVREGSAWRLDRPPFDPFGQGTPRSALRTFIRAIEGRHWEVLVELAPARYRGEITPAKVRSYWEAQGDERTRTLLRDLRLALDAPILEEGDEALLRYGSGRQVRFVREEGAWRIESPE
jgi:hypothetical protein